MNKARLEESYKNTIRSALKEELQLPNIMQVPGINKVVVNVGVKDAVSDSKVLQQVADIIQKITGQRPIRRSARKSIAGFKLREGMPIGVMVTLRGKMMYEFLDRLITLALPKVRDFQGVSTKLDGHGNYNLGIKDWSIFPEIDFEMSKKTYGMNITIQTSATKDEHGLALLTQLGMPFKKA